MARKKKHPEHVNHERWLVSYADFITLLFAFFVVMFAVSQVDSKKVGRFTASFSKAVGIDIFPETGVNLMGGNEAPAVAVENGGNGTDILPPELEGLKDALKAESTQSEDLKGLQIVQHKRELVLRLPDNIVFSTGDDTLKEGAMKMIQALAQQLGPRPVDVRVEGHTDNRPISTIRFRSNWDLSTARSTAVVVRFSKDGIANERLSAAGYGEFRPLSPNNTDAGRQQNRRVDIVISMSDRSPQDKTAVATVATPSAAATAVKGIGGDAQEAAKEGAKEAEPKDEAKEAGEKPHAALDAKDVKDSKKEPAHDTHEHAVASAH